MEYLSEKDLKENYRILTRGITRARIEFEDAPKSLQLRYLAVMQEFSEELREIRVEADNREIDL